MRRLAYRFTALSALVAVAAFTTAGCGLSDGTAQSPGQTTVTVYSPRPSTITDYVVKEFQAAHPEYKVQLLTLGAQEVADRVNAEKGRPQADIWWGGTPTQFEGATAKGLLTPFGADVLSRVPAKFHGSGDAWLAEQQQLQLIAYNHDMLKESDVPGDWADLILPQYKDKILIRDVAPSGTMRSVFSALIYQQYAKTSSPQAGYDFLKKLDANTKDYAANPSDLYLRLQRQEAALTIWNQQDILAQAAKGAPFSIKVPASGAPINLDGLAKVKGGPNAAGADAFAGFLLSDKTQAWLAKNAFQIPTAAIAEKPDWLAQLTYTELPVDSKVIAANSETWIQYWIDNIKNRG
ncbi:MAG: extracellular solute-binding protein [Hamadaea sp.]|uniref:extracellular solute-binding protein n=1 Tax=Hamadaea sp. TaxID=2024425 RepID=UPI001834C3E5|nr:extracellular solute-binding protein [Hamadaea sp.]NUT18773.1 extracellular solute-binding protein [Hamadaea sp.]